MHKIACGNMRRGFTRDRDVMLAVRRKKQLEGYLASKSETFHYSGDLKRACDDGGGTSGDTQTILHSDPYLSRCESFV